MSENLLCQSITYTGVPIEELAKQYNVTIEEIIKVNPGLDLSSLVIGDSICIPFTEQSNCPIGSFPYEIKQGDTLSSIATKFFSTEETILKNNPTIDPNNLEIGQVLCIIEPKPEIPYCPSMNVYVINKGDTLASIALQFGTKVEELININPGIDPLNLQVNDVICLPITQTPYIIVIDTANRILTLYYLGRRFRTYPIAIGKPSTPTPKGSFYIFNKQVNPGGPFGVRWMGLSQPHYGIHGTNRPDSIGKAASNGCIRMHKNGVEDLFSRVSVNTPVIII